MGLMDQIGGMLGGKGGQPDIGALLGRFTGGNANLQDPQSQDAQHFGQIVQGADRNDLASTFGQAAGQVGDQEYQQHITPGAGGTDPLGGLGGGALGTIASSLLGHLGNRAGGGGGLASMLGQIPGLSNTDPNQMNNHDVASLADWTRKNHPDAFGQAAADVGKRDPGLLHSLLGNKAMMAAAAGLAQKFMSQRQS